MKTKLKNLYPKKYSSRIFVTLQMWWSLNIANKGIVSLWFIGLSFLTIGQKTVVESDTITIYFDVGSSKVKPVFREVLAKLPEFYPLEGIDSLQFLGYADSTGSSRFNKRLSEKRIIQVLNACSPEFRTRYPYAMNPFGEKLVGDLSNNRKVELIIYQTVIEKPDDIMKGVDPKCFKVDLQSLSYCNIREVRKRRGAYVRIEAMDLDIITNQKHYYLQGLKDGKAVIRRIRWKKKMTGKYWWRERRLVVEIPKPGFEKFQIFTLFEAPCKGCSETIMTKDTIFSVSSHAYEDFFLMHNMQSRTSLFGGHNLTVRVPKDYVDTNERYFYRARYSEERPMHGVGWRNFEVDWYEKRRKKHQDYYYTKMHVENNVIPNIMKEKEVLVCLNSYKGGDLVFICGGVHGNLKPNIDLSFEPGIFMSNDTVTAFFALGANFHRKKWSTTLLGGLNSRRGFYGNLRARWYFFPFTIKMLFDTSGWHKTNAVKSYTSPYCNFYIGSELKTSYHQNDPSFFEVGGHLGFSISKTYSTKYANSLYFQFGVAKDLLNRINTQLYIAGQAGLVFNLF